MISGGIRQFLEQKMGPYRERLLGMHAVELDVSGPQMRLISEYDDGNELLRKTDVMALYSYDHAIGIGDSFTDMNMAAGCGYRFCPGCAGKIPDETGQAVSAV